MKPTTTQATHEAATDAGVDVDIDALAIPPGSSILDHFLWFAIKQRLATLMLVAAGVGFGLYAMPFDRADSWLEDFPSDPIPVDAIPDIGDRQQIVFTEWPGRSPQDVEDQVTFPLVSRLLGVPKVKTIRASSMFGFSSIYVIFEDDADFYDSRTRVLEKLQTAQRAIPPEAKATLGPDATALGQVLWYTVEGEGFDLDELRAVQDFTLKDALLGVSGVAEVAGIGGMQREIQVDVDPDAMRIYGVHLADIERAVAGSNLDVGAREVEINGVEYFVRGVGSIQSPDDVANAVIRTQGAAPLFVKNVAKVQFGPAPRRGALDKNGAAAVGGVVTARLGANPQAVATAVKIKIEEIAPGLPKKILADGRVSQMKVVPFYDRSKLIGETLDTLQEALTQQILICILVILLLLFELRSALLVAVTLPVGVLFTFGLMKIGGVDTNIMSLGGIIIAIGTMVDLGIIVTESMIREMEESPDIDRRLVLFRATKGIASAVLVAVATTIVSFLPVFSMSGQEARLFTPLAFTKTFALTSSIIVGLTLLPALASFVYRRRPASDDGVVVTLTRQWRVWLWVWGKAIGYLGIAAIVSTGMTALTWTLAFVVLVFAIRSALTALDTSSAVDLNRDSSTLPSSLRWLVKHRDVSIVIALAFAAVFALSQLWRPLGVDSSSSASFIFVFVVCGSWLGLLYFFLQVYPRLLRLALARPKTFFVLPISLVGVGLLSWLGAANVFAWVPAIASVVGVDDSVRQSRPWLNMAKTFPGMQDEFMPSLDEGTFLYMPTVMPHGGIGETLDLLQKMDAAIAALPEIETVVGKIGRAESPLDPAPLSMFEVVIEVKPEFATTPNEDGKRERQWRDHVKTLDDVWSEIVKAAKMPGTTSAPKLMPIETRLVMLQSGMRAPLGVKVYGRTLAQIESVALDVEKLLASVAGIDQSTIQADRTLGKPYLEIHIDRQLAARYGVRVADAQRIIQTALGGRTVTTTIQGRERYPVRVRYPREHRDTFEAMMRVAVPVSDGASVSVKAHVPLSQIATLKPVAGPLAIKSEDGFLVAYVTFGLENGAGEVSVAEAAMDAIDVALESNNLTLPAGALKPKVAGTYENQVRSEKTLRVVLPLALAFIFVLLLLQFGRSSTALIVFSSVAVAWAGGFVFLSMWSSMAGASLNIFGVDVIAIFAPTSVKLSVAVWVGFLALFGIASDDGVVMATFLEDSLDAAAKSGRVLTEDVLKEVVVEGAMRRIRPCLMTTATTVLALLPVLTSPGRGSDVMTPMALPTFGGMLFELLTLFVVPVLFYVVQVAFLRRAPERKTATDGLDA